MSLLRRQNSDNKATSIVCQNAIEFAEVLTKHAGLRNEYAVTETVRSLLGYAYHDMTPRAKFLALSLSFFVRATVRSKVELRVNE